MTRYDTFIRIDGSTLHQHQDAYEKAVLGLLKRLSRWRVGRLVLAEIKRAGERVTIRPAASIQASEATVSPERIVNPWKTPICWTPGESTLAFLPGNLNPMAMPGLVPSSSPVFLQTDPFLRPDEVLLHELVHCARVMQGLACRIVTGDDFDYMEEFYAITVTNVYRSERGEDNRLRPNHRAAYHFLRTTPEAFRSKHQDRFASLQRQMPEFTRSLATVPCRFNPFRSPRDYAGPLAVSWAA